MTTLAPSKLPVGTWAIDPIHSYVGFKVRHMGVANMRGEFNGFDGQITINDSGTSSITGTARVDSVVTRSEQLTGHLMAPDFFDAEQHPEITFHSTELVPEDDGTFHVAGEITIKGITRPIQLIGKLEGSGTDAMGNERLGVEFTGTLQRSEFEMNWNAPLPGGGLALSDTVHLNASFSALQQG